MSFLDITLAVHNLLVHLDAKPIKKKLRKIHPQFSLLVKEELERLLVTWFIRPIDYFDCLSNIFLQALIVVLTLSMVGLACFGVYRIKMDYKSVQYVDATS